MKLLTIFCLVSFSFVSAQELKLENYIESTSIVTENLSSKANSNSVVLPFLYDDKSIIAKKKSYKNIIENTLSGNKHLVFKIKRSTKVC